MLLGIRARLARRSPEVRRPEGPDRRFPLLSLPSSERSQSKWHLGHRAVRAANSHPFISLVMSSSAADRKRGRTTLVMGAGSDAKQTDDEAKGRIGPTDGLWSACYR